MTIIERAKEGKTDSLIRRIAKIEGISSEEIRKGLSKGLIAIPKNRIRDLSMPCGIGKNLKIKVNVNIGTSPDSSDTKTELKKLELSLKFGADTIMDLSIGKNIRYTRKKNNRELPCPSRHRPHL